MDYITEGQVFEYYQSKINNQISLESYINECVILAEGKNVISKLQAFNEEEKKTGWERIKEAFRKFGEFFKKIFAKFFDRMSRFIQGNKKWLDKHKALIINNKLRFEDITMYDYFTGIKRMVNASVPAFMDYENKIKDNLSSDKACYEWMARDAVHMDKFVYSESVDFTETVKNWFLGGENTVKFASSKINMSDIFNYCYTYEKMKDNIEKDQKILNRSLEEITKLISEKAAKITADEEEAKKPTEQQGDGQGGDSENPKPVQNVDASTNMALSLVYGTYITEADGPEFGDKVEDNKNSDSTTTFKANQKSGTVGDESRTAAANSNKNVDYGDKDSSEVENQNKADVDKVTSSKVIQEMGEALTRYRTASTSIFTSKLTAAEKCYKDFMKIMIAHVDSYINKTQTNDKASSVATDYSKNGEGENTTNYKEDELGKYTTINDRKMYIAGTLSAKGEEAYAKKEISLHHP